MTDSVRGPDGSDSSEVLCGTAPKRDAWRGGDSYEASMLRDLLSVIHRDGGHYVEERGLDKAIEDAQAKVLARAHALDELVALKGMKDTLEHPSIAWLDSGKLPEVRREYERRKEPAWQAAREAVK
jgi:hypothetical protein